MSTNSTAASAEASLANKKILIFIDYSNLDLSPFKLKNKFKNDFNFFDHNDLSKLITSKNKKIDKYSFYLKKNIKIIGKNCLSLFEAFFYFNKFFIIKDSQNIIIFLNIFYYHD